MSTTRRTAGVFSRKQPLGPHGEKLCYNCLGPLPKGRRYNCSEECSEKWQMRTSPAYVRFLLRRRDRGVCALCKVDTIAIQNEYEKLPKRNPLWDDHSSEPRREFLKQHGIPWGRASTDWWDADHIVPVIEGGGECDLSNYRTLCIPCHQKVTRELRLRMKERRDPNQRFEFVEEKHA